MPCSPKAQALCRSCPDVSSLGNFWGPLPPSPTLTFLQGTVYPFFLVFCWCPVGDPSACSTRHTDSDDSFTSFFLISYPSFYLLQIWEHFCILHPPCVSVTGPNGIMRRSFSNLLRQGLGTVGVRCAQCFTIASHPCFEVIYITINHRDAHSQHELPAWTPHDSPGQNLRRYDNTLVLMRV